MMEEALAYMRKDIDVLKAELEPHVTRIGVFGSALRVSLDKARDIDILVVVRGIRYEEIKHRLESMALSRPVYVNGTYSRQPDKFNGTQTYHIIPIAEDTPNLEFLAKNEGKIAYIWIRDGAN